MRSTKRVLLAAGPRLLREMLLHALGKADQLEMVGNVPNQRDLSASIERYDPEWVILSVPYSRHAHRWAGPFLEEHPSLRFVFLAPGQKQITMKWQASHEEFSNLSLRELIDILVKDLQHT